MISTESGTAVAYPRLLIHKQVDLAAAPITFCEYADGANNAGGLATITKVATPPDALTAAQTPLSMGVGSSMDCGSTQPPAEVVTEIWVPAGSAVDSAFYDVSATFVFASAAP